MSRFTWEVGMLSVAGRLCPHMCMAACLLADLRSDTPRHPAGTGPPQGLLSTLLSNLLPLFTLSLPPSRTYSPQGRGICACWIPGAWARRGLGQCLLNERMHLENTLRAVWMVARQSSVFCKRLIFPTSILPTLWLLLEKGGDGESPNFIVQVTLSQWLLLEFSVFWRYIQIDSS